MPTGYTAGVQDGTITEFQQYAIACARAFGACITMRDEPMNAPIPDEFQPSNWHAEQLAAARLKMQQLTAMTPDEIQAAHNDWFACQVKYRDERIAEVTEHRNRYTAMLSEVERWNPPSPDHAEFKKFMADQLRSSSTEFDCLEPDPIAKSDPAEWHKEQIKSCQWSIDYHERNYAEERERTAKRNEWLRLLRESLNTHEAKAG